MRSPIFKFLNLKEFCIRFKAPNMCNLYHIAEFLKKCPKVEKVLIDVRISFYLSISESRIL